MDVDVDGESPSVRKDGHPNEHQRFCAAAYEMPCHWFGI